MASCWKKGCLYSAVRGSNYCVQHQPEDKSTLNKTGRAIGSTPAAAVTPVADAIESVSMANVEIVRMDTVPKFKIQNQRSFELAKAVQVLKDDHALKITVTTDKERQPLAASVLSYCKKLGFDGEYRTGPRVVWIWKKQPATRGAK